MLLCWLMFMITNIKAYPLMEYKYPIISYTLGNLYITIIIWLIVILFKMCYCIHKREY